MTQTSSSTSSQHKGTLILWEVMLCSPHLLSFLLFAVLKSAPGGIKQARLPAAEHGRRQPAGRGTGMGSFHLVET